jgi:hypothetical protein
MGWTEMAEEKRGGMQDLMNTMQTGRMNEMAAEDDKKSGIFGGILGLLGGFASCFIPGVGPAIGVPMMIGGASKLGGA